MPSYRLVRRIEVIVLSVVFCCSRLIIFLKVFCFANLLISCFHGKRKQDFIKAFYAYICWNFWVAGFSSTQSEKCAGKRKKEKKTQGTLCQVVLWALRFLACLLSSLHFSVLLCSFNMSRPGFLVISRRRNKESTIIFLEVEFQAS